MSTVRPTWAEIDLDAFARNVDAIASRLPERSRLIAVLKANAYGHGAVELAHRLSRDRVAMIAVSLLEEALELGRAGITLPLLVLGPLNADQIALACEHDITIAITGPEVLDAIRRVDRDVVAHLKLDTGMGRMGVVETELAGVIDAIRATPRLRIDAIYTHLANASDPDDPFTDEQLARFRTYVETLREAGFTAPLHHVANSAATVRGLVEAGDYVRVGIALYGGAPLDGPPERPPDVGRPYVGQALSLSFEPVMRWRTAIARLKDLPPGHAIGYGTTFHTRRASRIATLPIGYADGYNRLLSNRGEVLVRGQRAPVVGRVSMDLVTIDVTDIPNAAIGDEVVLLGDGISAEEIASKVGTISYEVFCNVSARVPRVYLTHNRAS